MTDPNARFAGSIPENYHQHLGPLLFETFASDLARRLPTEGVARVLETACGSGILTRHLKPRLPAAARLVATDLNEPMLELARRLCRSEVGIEWRQADACALPFPAASFDAVVCQFGLMFVPDKEVACREARRVLAQGGRFLFNVWDSLERNDLPRVAHETIVGLFPVDPPTFYQIPFGFHDRAVLRALLDKSDFTEVRIEEVTIDGRHPSAGDLAIGLVEGNPIGNAIRERGTVPVGDVISAVAEAVRRRFGDRPVRTRLQALVADARAGAA